jgi:ribosomal protein L37AE/L43A
LESIAIVWKGRIATMAKLKKYGDCPSCSGTVVGTEGAEHGFCTGCGAKVKAQRAEPSDAIEKSVENVLRKFKLIAEEKPVAKPKEKPVVVPAEESEDDWL